MLVRITYPVRINDDVSDLIDWYSNELSNALDYLYDKCTFKNNKLKKLPDSSVIKELKHEIGSRTKYAKHYALSIVETAKSILSSYKRRYNKGLAKEKPKIKRKFVRVRESLLSYKNGVLKITIEPRKRYLEIDLKKCWFYDRIKGWKPCTVVIKENIAYITFKKKIDIKATNIIGIDMNLDSMDVVDSDGKWYRIDLSYLKRINEIYEKKINMLKSLYDRSGNKRFKALLDKYLNRRRNRINDFVHKLTKQLANMFPNAVFVVEDLNKTSMFTENSKWNKYLSWRPWKKIISYLSYKSNINGSIVLEVDPSFTSKTCPRCNGKLKREGGAGLVRFLWV